MSNFILIRIGFNYDYEMQNISGLNIEQRAIDKDVTSQIQIMMRVPNNNLNLRV